MKTALALLFTSLALAAAHLGQCHGRGLAFFSPSLQDRGRGLAFFSAPRSSLEDMLKDTFDDVRYTLEKSQHPIRDISEKYKKQMWTGAAGGVVGYGVAVIAKSSALSAVKIGCVGVGVYVVGAEMGFFGRDHSMEEQFKDKAQSGITFLKRKVDRLRIGLCDPEERSFAIGATAGALLAVAT
ncbi:hypothetical protein T484DRAFT_1932885 [Baffinella frigidus]|nr:hypothetical protein T484DRAFT_1932885 [Cryptophyta sp. CCMP2293]